LNTISFFAMAKKRKSSVGDALSTLTEALAEREKDLDAREEKLRQDLERYEEERSTDYGATTPNDVLHLNVGGTKTTVLRRTLISIPGSMLASRFSGRWDNSIEKDKDGNFFIDQNYHLFNRMLDYLRDKANGDDKYPLISPDEYKYPVDDGVLKELRLQSLRFYRMVEFYGMTNGIYPTKLTVRVGSTDSVEFLGSKTAIAKDWTTFGLALDGHTRRVKSFEVTLGTVQRIQIGWNILSSARFERETTLGVGDMDGTFALDLTRSSILYAGASTPTDGLEHPKGTVVRSEDYGNAWYINGVHVPIGDSIFHNLVCPQNTPLVSVKGEIGITYIELEHSEITEQIKET